MLSKISLKRSEKSVQTMSCVRFMEIWLHAQFTVLKEAALRRTEQKDGFKHCLLGMLI